MRSTPELDSPSFRHDDFDRHRPIVLVIVLHVGAIVSIQSLSSSLPYIQILEYPLLMSQSGLLAVWMVFGKSHWQKRVLVGLTAWWALSFYFATFTVSVWEAVLLGGDMAAVVFALTIGRFRGMSIAQPVPCFAAQPRLGQFTISGLLLLTTAIACLLGVGQWLIPWIPPHDGTPLVGPRLFAINLVFATAMAAVQIAVLWAVLSPYQVAWRLAAPPMVIAFAGLGIRMILSRFVHFDAFSVESPLIEGATIFAATLVAVRAAGYRWETARNAHRTLSG